ncbi:transcription elongation factor GreA [Candidatus Pacearchaeota archaeon]|nr:transcription elongation factor GreA [Candidatus Pacearchaeota archaeon]|tara:strand:- start:4865 stop:5338 length:474 start_codon:yes stop_codon:yes gene_type:complete
MRHPITQAGYNDLAGELKKRSTVVRLEIANEIERAREYGDISENAEFSYAKDRQQQNEMRINQIKNFISETEIITNHGLKRDGRVVFGVRAVLLNCDTDEEVTYKIVGETESDIKMGKISYKSPLASEIIGLSKGDDVEFSAPSGIKFFEILDVIYD